MTMPVAIIGAGGWARRWLPPSHARIVESAFGSTKRIWRKACRNREKIRFTFRPFEFRNRSSSAIP